MSSFFWGAWGCSSSPLSISPPRRKRKEEKGNMKNKNTDPRGQTQTPNEFPVWGTVRRGCTTSMFFKTFLHYYFSLSFIFSSLTNPLLKKFGSFHVIRFCFFFIFYYIFHFSSFFLCFSCLFFFFFFLGRQVIFFFFFSSFSHASPKFFHFMEGRGDLFVFSIFCEVAFFHFFFKAERGRNRFSFFGRREIFPFKISLALLAFILYFLCFVFFFFIFFHSFLSFSLIIH